MHTYPARVDTRTAGVPFPTTLDERQRAFAAALLDPARPLPPGLLGPQGRIGERRFAVYRNNVVAGLIETLKAAFPVVHRLVGDAFFSAMARAYAVHHLPGTPVMHAYGATFPDFIAAFDAASDLAYLPDVACLEFAWIESYHSADAPPIAPHRLWDGTTDPSRASLVLHPSARAIRSRFPIVTIWRMNVGTEEPGTICMTDQGEDALIVRPVADVEVRTLPAGAAVFIQALKNGTSLADAADLALGDSPDFDLACAIEGLVHSGTIVGWQKG